MCDHKHLIDRNDRLVLPDNVKPTNYLIHLRPNLKEFTFSGESDIKLTVVKPTKTVVIHSIELDIKLAQAGPSNKAVKIEYHVPEEVAILEFEHELTTDVTLHLEFTGILNDKLKGFYRSKYVVGGEDRYIATTQFEATDARRAFPCFDEPALKATFTIKLTVEKHLTALSNMDIIKEKTVTNPDSTITYTFEETPIMSTYLIAFVVGELTYIEDHTKEGIRVRVYNVIEKEESGKFALEVATKALSFFIDYFEIPYPLTKCDHIAIPDFSFGAMENWGLITYRESILLTSEKTTLRTLQRIANVIGHELAHQWFGNLVTMEWWSQLWLNEGFATFMGYLVTHNLFPEWNVWMDFSDLYRNGALTLDSLENSHPIEVPVRSSSQINEIFDAISYNKGSCVIQMVEGRFGDNFRKGLTHYLNKHSFKNTNTEDLWESLSILSGKDVKHFLDSFTKYSGYPVISFKTTSTPGQFELTQKKFKHGVESAEDPTWVCYIKVQTDSGLHEIVFDKKSEIITIPNYNPNGWIKPNFGQTGYYRIDYDVSIIKGLIPQIKSLSLPAVDRHGLLVDTFYLARNKTIPITVFMDLVAAFENETEFSIWSFIVDRLTYLSHLSEGESYHSKLNEITIKLLKPISKKLGFEPIKGESPSDVLLREKILAKLGVLGEPETLAECRKRFEEFKKDEKTLASDIRNTVLASVLVNGGESEQQEIIEKYLKSHQTADKISFLSVLPMGSTESLVEKALEFSVSKDVRSQDTYMVWVSVPNKFKSVAWKYLVKNFQSIDKQFHESGLFPRIIMGCLKSRLPQSSIDEVEKFFKDHPVPIAERSIKQDLETIIINNHFFDSCNNDLKSWVDNFKL
eukprot:gene11218-13743_t